MKKCLIGLVLVVAGCCLFGVARGDHPPWPNNIVEVELKINGQRTIHVWLGISQRETDPFRAKIQAVIDSAQRRADD